MINELKVIIVEEHHPALDKLSTCVLQKIGKIKPPKHSKKGADVTHHNHNTTVCGIAINKAIMKCIGNNNLLWAKNSRKEDEVGSMLLNHLKKAFEEINKYLTDFLKNGFQIDGDTEKGVDNFGMGKQYVICICRGLGIVVSGL